MTETATATPINPVDMWTSGGTGGTPGSASTGSGSITIPGSVTIPGYGATQMWSGGKPVASRGNMVFNGSTGTLSASDIKNLFIRMDSDNDPFLKKFMGDRGITDKKLAKAVWDDAADYAVKLAKTGKPVDFFKDVLDSETFYSNYLTIPKSLLGGSGSGSSVQPIQHYMTNYFTAKGQPNAAAKQLLKDQLAKVFGRAATAQELAEYKPLLTEMYQQQKAGLFTKSYNPNSGVTTEAIDPTQWLSQQVANKHQARVQYGKEGAVQSNRDQYTQLAADYGFNVYGPDNATLSPIARDQLAKLDAGKMTIDEIAAQFKTAALAHYAYLKPQFDAGLTLKQIAAPAMSAISSILEKDPNTISINDTLVQKYLQGTDGKGVMPIYKYESLLKQDPSWQFTNNAHQTFADLAMQLGQRFGMVG